MYSVKFPLSVFFISLLLPAFIAGCRATPFDTVPEASRLVMEEQEEAPVAIRLTQPVTVFGFSLPAGSIMRQTGETTCSVFPSETIYVGGILIPAASEIQLVETKGDFIWNGKVILSDATVISGIELVAGDGAFFTGNLPDSPQLAQVRLGNQRELAGTWYPAGTIVNVTPSGAIGNIIAAMPPDELAKQQALYLNQKAQREAQCQKICAPHKDDADAQSSCLDYCMNQ